MIRLPVLVAAIIITATTGFALAAGTTPSAPPDIEVDAGATINTVSKKTSMLTGLYATQAVIDICSISVSGPVATRMGNDRTRFEAAIGLDASSAAEAYQKIKANVASTSPDCTQGSSDRQEVEAVLTLYADN